MKINNGEELLEKFAKKLVLDRGRVFEVTEKAVEVERILDEVQEKILDTIIGKLPDAQLDKLYELTQGEELAQDELEAVMEEAGLDYGEVIRGVLEDYRKAYLEEEK